MICEKSSFRALRYWRKNRQSVSCDCPETCYELDDSDTDMLIQAINLLDKLKEIFEHVPEVTELTIGRDFKIKEVK